MQIKIISLVVRHMLNKDNNSSTLLKGLFINKFLFIIFIFYLIFNLRNDYIIRIQILRE